MIIVASCIAPKSVSDAHGPQCFFLQGMWSYIFSKYETFFLYIAPCSGLQGGVDARRANFKALLYNGKQISLLNIAEKFAQAKAYSIGLQENKAASLRIHHGFALFRQTFSYSKHRKVSVHFWVLTISSASKWKLAQ